MGYDADIVIVGAGIAGGALATALGRSGLSVLLLEKSLVHRDIVRGEFLVPWGVDEAGKLGVLDVLLAAGGHYTPMSVPYGEGVPPDAARKRTMDFGTLVDGVPGPLNFGHPQICQALDDAAEAAGVTFLRGVGDVTVTAGTPPRIAFTCDGMRHELAPRIVIGADGRGSSVARQAGLQSEAAPQHHLLTGLLVEGADAWPKNEFCIGNEGDLLFYIFPQTGNRLRLYLAYGLDQPTRFSGADNARKFLDAFRFSCLPDKDLFASATPAGPCHGYPNADRWIDTPVAPGIVLIGDAAGHNDPTIGQGLALAFRDARLVSEILRGTPSWTIESFLPYADERRERLRRMRFAGQQYSILRAEFTEAALERRKRAYARMAADPSLLLLILATQKGPYGVPDEFFQQPAWDRLLN